MPVLAPAPGVDIAASLAAFGTYAPGMPQVEKDQHDIHRYVRAIVKTKPHVLIECGTNTGASANFFAQRVPWVITIDCDIRRAIVDHDPGVTRLVGDTTNPDLVARVLEMVGRLRVMVSLDSDHTADHVAREIRLWAPLVSLGCYLIIEDGIYHWGPDPSHLDWDPLRAITDVMPTLADFERDLEIEGAYPITGSPAGWWVRTVSG